MRASGILMAVSSLPSPHGIGTFGREAYRFADFLARAGQKYWQILPLNPVSFGDSPYQSFSSFAGNPYYIDLDLLCEQGYLKRQEYMTEWGSNPESADYGLLYKNRYRVLKTAARRFLMSPPEDFHSFCENEADWLESYSLFMALKDENKGKSWMLWDDELRFRHPSSIASAAAKLTDSIDYWKCLQYLFFSQWSKLKKYVNSLGISIIGDIPIYVSADSADVWSDPRQFRLDSNLRPELVAGCPPDNFSKHGQLWGNPLFDWDYMEKNSFGWWTERIRRQRRLYDVIRIDHFRGFESYYAIPASSPDAASGSWQQGPGLKLFETMEKELGPLPLIAEDLGFLTPQVKKMLKQSGYPGMKILQFAFDSREDSDYLPHNYEKNSVVYTGTHDNDTIIGFMNSIPQSDKDFAVEYLGLSEAEGYNWGMMRAAWRSTADTAIVTMQDLLGLGSWARMNTPSTIGSPNWCWRAKPEDISEALADKIYHQTALFKRQNM